MINETALVLTVFVGCTFAAAFAAQVAGFTYGLVAAAVWLQLLTPLQTVTLIIAFGPVVQGFNGWHLRTAPTEDSVAIPYWRGDWRTRRRHGAGLGKVHDQVFEAKIRKVVLVLLVLLGFALALPRS